MADNEYVRERGGGDIRPIPDPTNLTTEAALRQEAMIRNLINSEIGHANELADVKLRGAINTLSEKMSGVIQRLDLLDARTAEQKQDTTNALNAALAAQKEAVAAQTASSEKSITKSETATTERIKGVETLLSTSTKATDDKITDLKDRVIAIEAVKLGTVEAGVVKRADASATSNLFAIGVSVLFLLVAVASIFVAIYKP